MIISCKIENFRGEDIIKNYVFTARQIAFDQKTSKLKESPLSLKLYIHEKSAGINISSALFVNDLPALILFKKKFCSKSDSKIKESKYSKC